MGRRGHPRDAVASEGRALRAAAHFGKREGEREGCTAPLLALEWMEGSE